MSFQKQKTNIALLLSFTILGLVYSQISVPLKINNNSQLYFTSTNSISQCTTDIAFVESACINLQIYKTPDAELCVSNPKGPYNSDFIFGNAQINLSYDLYTEGYRSSQPRQSGGICMEPTQDKRTVLSLLVSQKLISKQIIYFYLFQSMDYRNIIGEVNFGSPNYNNIKKGAKLVQLKQTDRHYNYAVYNRGLKFFGEQMENRNVVFTLSDEIVLTKNNLLQMVYIFKQKGIPYTMKRYDGFYSYRVYLPSIEKLEPIELSLVLEDNRSYSVTLQASQYTRQLPNGSYELTIQTISSQSDYIYLGKSILQTHYVGFDQFNGTVQIAEKGNEDRSLRRSQNNYD